ncbi:UDP-glucose/GDP-mannose dehydrogenase family protein [Paenibacillus sediminis]|uniref:UDP-glucose 6-dehydrogenase n=1 Tax=Paenibacillus sediminis TaxID=664909 RepID=A0ABS4H5W3_9BACL|nr:UDP-glucose 6-dehydrogenase [Paenibacillus sediminis]
MVRVHDPLAKVPAYLISQRLTQCHSPEQAVQKVDAVIICTEWPLYQKIDWLYMKELMNKPYIFDGRNMLDAKQMISMGYDYYGVGNR